jgi:hypothetical protein
VLSENEIALRKYPLNASAFIQQREKLVVF